MKIAFILPYFGKFDSLFPLWLESCRYNADIDWLLFTDDRRDFHYPVNVKVHYMEFSELQERVQSLYDFPIALASPYRLCNFKPAYGEIFENYLGGYDAWGFCDNDMLYGDMLRNMPIDFEQSKIPLFKIGKYGHASFLTNTQESRHLYRYADAYKIALGVARPLFFDEGTFQLILEKHGYKELPLHIADFMPRLKQHEVLEEPGREWMNNAHCFVWNKGILLRYFVNKQGRVDKEEYAYIHFLKRPMIVDLDIDLSKPLVIIPNRIMNMPLEQITPDFLKRVSRKGIFWQYWKNSLKPKNLIERFKNRLYQNKRDQRMICQMNQAILNNNNCTL